MLMRVLGVPRREKHRWREGGRKERARLRGRESTCKFRIENVPLSAVKYNPDSILPHFEPSGLSVLTKGISRQSSSDPRNPFSTLEVSLLKSVQEETSRFDGGSAGYGRSWKELDERVEVLEGVANRKGVRKAEGRKGRRRRREG